jgi:hypothetical protein
VFADPDVHPDFGNGNGNGSGHGNGHGVMIGETVSGSDDWGPPR